MRAQYTETMLLSKPIKTWNTKIPTRWECLWKQNCLNPDLANTTRSSLLQDKRQNCVQRLDLSTPIFYCQPNISNIKRTVRETITKITIARISRLCQHKLHLTSSKQTTKSHVVFAFILPIFYCQTMHHRPNRQFGGHNTPVTSVARISHNL